MFASQLKECCICKLRNKPLLDSTWKRQFISPTSWLQSRTVLQCLRRNADEDDLKKKGRKKFERHFLRDDTKESNRCPNSEAIFGWRSFPIIESVNNKKE